MDIIVYAARCPEGEEHISAWELLTLAMERELGIMPLPQVARGELGKPFFPERPEICFNLTHSHGAVACAIHDREIGVDMEQLRPAPPRVAKGMSDEAFFLRWTAMEATVKREGKDWRSLHPFPEPDPGCRCLDGLLPGWIITLCPSGEGDLRAVAIEQCN